MDEERDEIIRRFIENNKDAVQRQLQEEEDRENDPDVPKYPFHLGYWIEEYHCQINIGSVAVGKVQLTNTLYSIGESSWAIVLRDKNDKFVYLHKYFYEEKEDAMIAAKPISMKWVEFGCPTDLTDNVAEQLDNCAENVSRFRKLSDKSIRI